MKTTLLRIGNCKAVSLFLLCLFVGCSTTTRKYPPTTPRFVTDYCDPNVHEKLKDLPIRFILRNCQDSCIMTSETMMGNTTFEFLKFRPIVEQEFKSLIAKNFCKADDNGAMVDLVVTLRSTGLSLDKDGDILCCVEFSVKLQDRFDNSKRAFFAKIYTKEALYHDIEGLVPCSLYAAVQKVAKQIISDISCDSGLMEQLAKMSLPEVKEDVVEYGFTDKIKEGVHYRESAHVKCSKDDPDRVKERAIEDIKNRGRRYGSEYCVFFSYIHFDEEARRWTFYYDIVAKAPFMQIPSANGRSGRCFIDSSKYRIYDNVKAATVMKNMLSALVKEKNGIEVRNVHRDEENKNFFAADYEYK